MLSGIQTRIVLPLLGVYLLTIAAGAVLVEWAVQAEVGRRREVLRQQQAAIEAEALSSARALAKIGVLQHLQPSGLDGATNNPQLRQAAQVMGRPISLIDSAGLVVTTYKPADARRVAEAVPELLVLIQAQNEGVGDATVGGSRVRAIWTPADTDDSGWVLRPRRRWLVVLLPASPELPAEPALVTPLVWIALGGATILVAAGSAVSWFWARRVTALVRRVESWRPDLQEDLPLADPGEAAPADEIGRLTVAFDDLRRRLDHYRAELVVRERLAAAGQVAAMMAHEIRNPLAALKLSAQMLVEEARSGPPAGNPVFADTLQVMLREIARLQILCDQLLTLSGQRIPVREPVHLGDVVTEVCQLLSGQAEQSRVRLVSAVPSELPPLTADGSQLRQLLMNLVLNAMAAALPDTDVKVSAAYGPSGWHLAVIDRGPGIDVALVKPHRSGLLSHKPGGAGLGLTICQKIVDSHGGRLVLTNRGDGTTAEVFLPGESDSKPISR